MARDLVKDAAVGTDVDGVVASACGDERMAVCGFDIDHIIAAARINACLALVCAFDRQRISISAQTDIEHFDAAVGNATGNALACDDNIIPHAQTAEAVRGEHAVVGCRAFAVKDRQRINLIRLIHAQVGIHRRVGIKDVLTRCEIAWQGRRNRRGCPRYDWRQAAGQLVRKCLRNRRGIGCRKRSARVSVNAQRPCGTGGWINHPDRGHRPRHTGLLILLGHGSTADNRLSTCRRCYIDIKATDGIPDFDNPQARLANKVHDGAGLELGGGCVDRVRKFQRDRPGKVLARSRRVADRELARSRPWRW